MKTLFPFVPKPLLLLISILLAFLLGAIDYVTAPEIAIFYLLPIFLASWTLDRRAGIFLSILSAVIWYVDDITKSPAPGSYVHYWEAAVRFGFFILFSFIISRLRRALEEEKELSRTDAVTRIANGRYFIETAEAEIRKLGRYKHPLTLAYMDVDNFKAVNDHLGHSAGDALLRLIASTIRKNIRSTDLAARIGGDEFTILFPETGFGQTANVIEKIQRELLHATRHKGFPVTFSMGVVTFADAPPSINDAIRIIDNVMYDAKKAGKNMAKYELWENTEKEMSGSPRHI